MLARNLTAFSEREFMMVRDLMDSYINHNETVFFKQAMFVQYNQEDGLVFLEDIHGKKACYNWGRRALEDWLECPECGQSGFYRDFFVKCGYFKCCAEFFKEISSENTDSDDSNTNDSV